MKCKFMPLVEQTLQPLGIVQLPIIRDEYAECLYERCPYYGIERRYFSSALKRYMTYIEPACRRADNG